MDHTIQCCIHVSPTTHQPPQGFESFHGRSHRELDDRDFSHSPTWRGHSLAPETKDRYSTQADNVDKEQTQ